MDASNSLNSTDPTLRRVSGIIRSVDTLTDLAVRYGDDVDIRVAVDTFSEGYYRHLAWSSPEDAGEVLSYGDTQDRLGTTVVGPTTRPPSEVQPPGSVKLPNRDAIS